MLILITFNSISPNSWVEAFSKLFHSENTQYESSSTKHTINGVDPLLDSPFTAEEISDGIKQLKDNKVATIPSVMKCEICYQYNIIF